MLIDCKETAVHDTKIIFLFNKYRSFRVKKHKNKIACVIMEPETVSEPKCMEKEKCKLNCRNFCKENQIENSNDDDLLDEE